MELSERVAALEANQKTIFLRLNEEDRKIDNLTELTYTVKEIAVGMGNMSEKLDKIDQRMGDIEQEPLKNIKHYKRVAVGAIITAIVGFLFGIAITIIQRG